MYDPYETHTYHRSEINRWLKRRVKWALPEWFPNWLHNWAPEMTELMLGITYEITTYDDTRRYSVKIIRYGQVVVEREFFFSL